MELLNTDEKSLGFQKINDLFENLKEDLTRIGEIENFLNNTTVVISKDEGYNTYEEMGMVINSELKDYKKSKSVLIFFKWMLILFEALSGYLAIGLITHAINFGLEEIWLQIIKGIFAIALSYAIVNFAINSIKDESDDDKNKLNFLIAFGAILALPIFNVSMIYFVNLDIDFKEIYIVSLFFTAFAGSLLVLKSKEKNKKEEKRISKLLDFKKVLLERKTKYKTSRKKHLAIFKENNKYEGVLESEEELLKGNILYTGLKKFITECDDFDDWSEKFIKNVIEKQKTIEKTNS